LPSWMQAVSRALPPSYIFEAMRAIVLGHPQADSGLWWALGLALLYICLACGFFVHVYKVVVRSGLIARYSAESVS